MLLEELVDMAFIRKPEHLRNFVDTKVAVP